MFYDEPTPPPPDKDPNHHCDFPWDHVFRLDEIKPIWKCDGLDGCGMEFDVTIGGWHHWWSPVTETGTTKVDKYGYSTIYCTQERLVIIEPRVEFQSRGKMPNGYTLGTQFTLAKEDREPRPPWIPDLPDGYIRDISPHASSRDREVNVLGSPPLTQPKATDSVSPTKKPKKRKWLMRQ